MATSAVPFVLYDDDTKKYVVTDEAAAALDKLTGSIGVVVVAGRYRSGKSFLNNKLVRADTATGSGFGVGHTVESYTKGIWMWPHPVKAKTSTGEEVEVIVMDSEGLGATEQTEHHDTEVFSLATLLCSVLIFNGSSTIDETSIQTLGFIANLTKHIRLQSNRDGGGAGAGAGAGGGGGGGGDDTMDDFTRFFPSFVWVLRDFSLELVDHDGRELTPNEYMESSLKEQVGFDKDTLSRNRIRKCVTGFFRDRCCFTLVRPVEAEAKLQSLDTVPESDLRPKFMDQLNRLRGMLFDNARVKTVSGRPLNGPMLTALARSYVDAINSGGVPSVADAWESAAGTQCKRIVEDATALYAEKLDAETGLPVSEEDLRARHAAALGEATAMFDRLAPTAPTVTPKFRSTLEENCAGLLVDAEAANARESARVCKLLCRQLREKHVTPVVDAVQADLESRAAAAAAGNPVSTPLSTFPAVQKAWDGWGAWVKDYRDSAAGPSVDSTLVSAGVASVRQDIEEITRLTDAALESQARTLRDALAVEQRRASGLATQLSTAEQSLQEQRSLVADLKVDVAERDASVTAVRDQMAAVQSKLSVSQTNADTAEAEVRRLESRLQRSEEQLTAARTDLGEQESEVSDLRASLATAETRAGELEAAMHSLTATYNEEAQRLDAARRSGAETADQLAAAQAEAAAKADEANKAHQKLDDVSKEATQLRDTVSSLQSELRALQDAHASSTAQSTATQEKLAAAANKAADLQAQLDRSNAELADTRASSNSTAAQLSDLEAQVRRLTATNKDLEALCDESRQRLQDVTARFQASERESSAQHESLQSQLAQFRASSADLEAKAAGLESCKAQLRTAEAAVADLEGTVRQLRAHESTWRAEQAQHDILSEKVEELRAELRAERDDNAKLRQDATSARANESQLQDAKERAAVLERRLADAQVDAERASGLATELEASRSDRDRLAAEMETTRTDLHRARGTVLELQEAVSRKDVAAREVAVQYELRQQSLAQNVSELQSALDKERTRRQTVEMMATELKRQIAGLRLDAYKVDSAKKELAQAKERLEVEERILKRAQAGLADSKTAESGDVRVGGARIPSSDPEVEAARLEADAWQASQKTSPLSPISSDAVVLLNAQLTDVKRKEEKSRNEAQMLQRLLTQAQMQRKALRKTIMRMADELRHERAAREAADASLKASLEREGRSAGENRTLRQLLGSDGGSGNGNGNGNGIGNGTTATAGLRRTLYATSSPSPSPATTPSDPSLSAAAHYRLPPSPAVSPNLVPAASGKAPTVIPPAIPAPISTAVAASGSGSGSGSGGGIGGTGSASNSPRSALSPSTSPVTARSTASIVASRLSTSRRSPSLPRPTPPQQPGAGSRSSFPSGLPPPSR